MALSLAEIRARLTAQENKTTSTTQKTYDNVLFPHWNIPDNSIASLRFLPDGNQKNEFFWAERQMIKLPFSGVVGRPDIKRVEVQVPCIETPAYGNQSCPVHAELRTWYKDDSMKELANKYWKKRSYIFQGFVRTNPLTEDSLPENPIRRFLMSPQIISIIKSSLMDPELDVLPTDYTKGLDFNVKKTKKGEYADYSTSTWSRRESSLTDEELSAIETHGLFDLYSFLPKQPSEEELKIIVEMFEASVDGKQYDLERWGQYYKPYGIDNPEKKSSSDEEPKRVISTAMQKQVDDDEPSEFSSDTESSPLVVPKTESKAVSSEKANDILARIRARQREV